MGFADTLLSKYPLKTSTFTVEAWGESVTIREWSSLQRAEFFAIAKATKDKAEAGDPLAGTAALKYAVAHSCIDAEGKPLFTDADLERVFSEAGQAAAAGFNEVFKRIVEINGIGSEQVEQAAKN